MKLSSMHCEICKRDPVHHGVSLHRQNEKGVKGVWRCDDCNMKPVDRVVQMIADALDPQRKGVTKQ